MFTPLEMHSARHSAPSQPQALTSSACDTDLALVPFWHFFVSSDRSLNERIGLAYMVLQRISGPVTELHFDRRTVRHGSSYECGRQRSSSSPAEPGHAREQYRQHLRTGVQIGSRVLQPI